MDVVRLHHHALTRLAERGASIEEVIETVRTGERIPAHHGRTGFRRNFAFGGTWRGRSYLTKQIEAYAVEEDNAWLVITLITRFF